MRHSEASLRSLLETQMVLTTLEIVQGVLFLIMVVGAALAVVVVVSLLIRDVQEHALTNRTESRLRRAAHRRWPNRRVRGQPTLQPASPAVRKHK